MIDGLNACREAAALEFKIKFLNSTLKKNAIKVEDIDYRPPQVILEKEGEDMFSQYIFRRTFMHLLHICLSLILLRKDQANTLVCQSSCLWDIGFMISYYSGK